MTIQLHALLVPLEAMQALGELWPEAALDVVVHAEVAFDDISEIPDNLVCILVKQALQLAHFLVVIEILFILSVKLDKDTLKVLERLNQLLSAALLR